jgi:hypothetical protein
MEKPKNEESKMPPVWAWIFIIACGAIPVISLGGAIPGAIGFGTAAACYQIARDGSRSTQTRVLFCLGITVLAWALFLGFVFVLAPAIMSNL